MPGAPQATLVMPLRAQRDDWLRQALASALDQTRPCEVIAITAEDTPASNLAVLAGLARGRPQLRAIRRPPGAGFAQAINLGFNAAACQRVGLLLSDDWLAPEALELCLGEVADIVATGRRGYDADASQVLWERCPDQARFDALPGFEAKASYIGHFLLLRRTAVLAAGGVDPHIGLTGADDYDLIWTLLERGASVRLVCRALYHYRDHAGDRLTNRAQAEQVRDLRRILAKHGVDPVETERLVAEKRKWYGVPCHVALRDPQWYLRPGAAAPPSP